MAAIFDVDEPYRTLAARVPEDIRQSLSPLELRLRCTEAFQILASANELSDDVKRDREKAKAGRVLKAASPASYSTVMAVMGSELKQAQLDGNDRKAAEIQRATADYARRNPQPSQETVLAAARAAVSRLKIPPAMPSHESGITRRFGKTRKGRR